MSDLPKGISILCNDLGEIEKVVHDDIGLPSLEDAKTGKVNFFRLIDRPSMDKARAFITDLRISRKQVNQILTVKTKDNQINIYFSGARVGRRFLIVGARNADDLQKLYAEIQASVEQQKPQPENPVRQRTEEPKNTPRPVAELEKLTSELSHTRDQLDKKNEELDKTSQDLYALATIDTLTGVYNRRHFLARVREELRAAERYKRSPAFLVIDVDNLSQINERHGYQTGDEILKSVGDITLAVLRKVDIVGRLDGDEFGALLLEITRENSVVIAKRLQKKLSDITIEVKGNSFQVTVSVALIHLVDGKGALDKLLRQAEKLLQKAKQAGGNQVIQA